MNQEYFSKNTHFGALYLCILFTNSTQYSLTSPSIVVLLYRILRISLIEMLGCELLEIKAVVIKGVEDLDMALPGCKLVLLLSRPRPSG